MAGRRRRGAAATMAAVHEPGVSGAAGSGRRERERVRQCAMPHCERYYVRCRHTHGCSMCSVGQHTARCDDEWRRYQERQIRAQARATITQCVVRACTRIAGVGHVHCCTLCCPSKGQEHTEQCQGRQQYVHVVGGMAMAGGEAGDQGPVRTDRPGPAMGGMARSSAESFEEMGMEAATGTNSEAATSSTGRPSARDNAMPGAIITELIEVFDSEEEADMLNRMD